MSMNSFVLSLFFVSPGFKGKLIDKICVVSFKTKYLHDFFWQTKY